MEKLTIKLEISAVTSSHHDGQKVLAIDASYIGHQNLFWSLLGVTLLVAKLTKVHLLSSCIHYDGQNFLVTIESVSLTF